MGVCSWWICRVQVKAGYLHHWLLAIALISIETPGLGKFWRAIHRQFLRVYGTASRCVYSFPMVPLELGKIKHN